MRIEIAVDHIEGPEFLEWLQRQGHDAHIGTSTGNFVDGENTSSDERVGDIMRSLWEQYCR